MSDKTAERLDPQSTAYTAGVKPETLLTWLGSSAKAGIRNTPNIAKSMLIKIGIAILFQLVFWWEGIAQFIPSFIKGPVIFLTATYNNIIPKTLYWVIVFTFGKRLVTGIKTKGFLKTMKPIATLPGELKRAYGFLKDKALSLLLLGGGIGLIIANNFASYSRFSGARNKLDKYLIALVISFTVSYLLGEGKKHGIFKFGRLAASDLSRIFRFKNTYSDDHTYVIMSGFVLGLLADAPLILIKLKYGGYILGAAVLIAGIVLKILKPKKEVKA
jgi:hypothetical protein